MKEKNELVAIIEELFVRNPEMWRGIIVTAGGVVNRERVKKQSNNDELWGAPGTPPEKEILILSVLLLNLSHHFKHPDGEATLDDKMWFVDVRGSIVVIPAGPKAILVVIQDKDSIIGRIDKDCNRACKKIRELISQEYPDLVIPSNKLDVHNYVLQLLHRFEV